MQQYTQQSIQLMASQKSNARAEIREHSALVRHLVTLYLLTVSSEGFCQLTNATTKLTSIQTWLAGLAITIFTIVFMYVGYALAFGGKSFGEVWKILVGGFFVGGAAGLASFAAG